MDVRLIGSQDEGTTVHVSRVERFAGPELDLRVELQRRAQHDAAQFEVEEMLATRVHKGVVEVQVSWLGFPSSYDSWEPAAAIAEYVPKLVLAELGKHRDDNELIDEMYDSLT